MQHVKKTHTPCGSCSGGYGYPGGYCRQCGKRIPTRKRRQYESLEHEEADPRSYAAQMRRVDRIQVRLREESYEEAMAGVAPLRLWFRAPF